MTASDGAPPPLLDRRRAGVLLHVGSLDSGHGALGANARRFIDWLASAGFSVWQVLPLSPVSAEGSPYWTRSDFAGSPALLDRNELADVATERVDFDTFLAANAYWLDDYVVFEALAERFGGAPWWEWPEEYRNREDAGLRRAHRYLARALERRRREQWQFERQWRSLRNYASERGVHLFGDLPIYVAPDSVGAWAQREQFQLQPDGRPALLAGVPPDYFSADGQLWGNPLYQWPQAERDGFAFWKVRLARQLQRFDLLRIDHFRGLAAYWGVPAGALTAREGSWYPAPGEALLHALASAFPSMPFVAEDLGVITPDVEALRDRFNLSGMRVVQFGFDGKHDNPHLPQNFIRNAVAYTGTHDNDTTLGWYASLDQTTRAHVDFYLGAEAGAMPQAMVRAVLASVAQLAVIPAQDLLGLGSEARLNRPGTHTGNWSWHLPVHALSDSLAIEYQALNGIFDRSYEA